jgi:hypothetical protein
MPQFDTMTFFSQTFWVFFFFIGLYLVMINSALPLMSKTLKARRKKILWDSNEVDSIQGEDSSIFASQDVVISKALSDSKDLLVECAALNSEWSSENIKSINNKVLIDQNSKYLTILGSNVARSAALCKAFSKN